MTSVETQGGNVTYTPTRPMMTSEELALHLDETHGRNYGFACDGYEDMELAAKMKWRQIYAWGRDGWDLGKIPYVNFAFREVDGSFQLLTTCEGDHTYYNFDSEADREAAVDYLFLWYAADERWAPLTYEQREALDNGEVTVDVKFRGPFSWARCDTEKEKA